MLWQLSVMLFLRMAAGSKYPPLLIFPGDEIYILVQALH